MPEQIKCLAVAASPRKDGNTALLARQALAGCREAGAETEFLYLADYAYAPCRGCEACSKTGRCVVADDAKVIFDRILAADRLILAAPIFSMGICAQAKMLIDRAQQFWATKYVLKRPVIPEAALRPPRRGIYIATAGTNLPGVFDGAIRVVKYFFKMLEIDLTGTFCYPRVDAKGSVKDHPTALAECLQAGRELG
ncbi:flavodoxin family protein [Desulfotomaculum copahuensis]|uniref:NADPH-dependent FMN reductase n=1 Tax=Desulfotomaculum copahuensis TaxID=1838280 RepID=A0A1B7LIN7_9FIRM|nr:flavodoxin family protein [Desulfotomaculum copahuensis]OAT86438.1 NADPH-dependent FMN reductase [Desulfotomaculum copahuensis]